MVGQRDVSLCLHRLTSHDDAVLHCLMSSNHSSQIRIFAYSYRESPSATADIYIYFVGDLFGVLLKFPNLKQNYGSYGKRERERERVVLG